MKIMRSVSFPLAPSAFVLLSLLLAGCSGDTTTTVRFVQSPTAPAPGLVKLAEAAASGSRIVVDVLIHGPEPDLDLKAFEFAIVMGDPSLIRFVPQATYVQTALVAGDGQAIAIDVDGTSDPSQVAVVVAAQGGGPGNGFAADSVIVIELTFETQGTGVTSLSLGGLGANPPRALDSALASIRTVRFDDESAGVSVVTTETGY